MKSGNSWDLLKGGNTGRMPWAEKIWDLPECGNTHNGAGRPFGRFFYFLHFLQNIIYTDSAKYYFAFSAKSTLLF